VREVHEQSEQVYGSYKIVEVMQSDVEMESAWRNTVATAMSKMGLKSRVLKKFTPTTTVVDPSKKPAANLLDQVFTADAPNQKWVTDITYLPTQEGWVYLAAVLDLFSRRIVGWAMSISLATPLADEALRRVIESRRPHNLSALMHHSDRGCQYTSNSYQKTLPTLGITCPMSRTGCCYDNAVMERFFWSLKHEWTKHEQFADLEEARISVFGYIETLYNSSRIHQTLNYRTPDQFERNYAYQLANQV
jgi:putative transposase